MIRALKAFFPAVLLAYVLGTMLATQMILGNVEDLGLSVSLTERAAATLHDVMGMASSYLLLILVAFILALPVAAALSRWMPGHRALLYALAGFVGILALHLIMKALLGVTGIAAARTIAGLLGQGLAGAAGGLCFHWLSRPAGGKA